MGYADWALKQQIDPDHGGYQKRHAGSIATLSVPPMRFLTGGCQVNAIVLEQNTIMNVGGKIPPLRTFQRAVLEIQNMSRQHVPGIGQGGCKRRRRNRVYSSLHRKGNGKKGLRYGESNPELPRERRQC